MSRARAIETRLEKQLPILNEFFTSGFLTRDEIRELTRQRTHWEYRLVAKPLLLLDVQHAILYELSIEEKLQQYCIRSKLTLKHRWSVLERIEGIYRIGLKNLHNAAESELLRNEYVQFLKRFSRHTSLSRMYAQMMIKFPTREDIWTEAALYEGMENNNMDNARVIIQRAIANMGQHSRVWCGALELELHFASRLLNGVIEEFEQEMLKKQETNPQILNNGDAKETEVMSINAQVEREAKELPSKLRNENEAMAHIMLDLALAQDVIDEAMVSKASGSPQLVREMINVMGKYKFTRSLLEHLLHVALRDGIKQAQSNFTSTTSQKSREEWKAFLPTLICNLCLIKEDILTNNFTHILVNPETYLHKLGGNKPVSSSSKVLEKKHKVKAKKDALISCIVHLYEFMYQCSVCSEENQTDSCTASSSSSSSSSSTTAMKSIDRQTLFSHAFDQLERCFRELAYYLPDGVSSVCSQLIKMAMMPHNIKPSINSSKSESNDKEEEILTEQMTKVKTKKNSKSKVMSENEEIDGTEDKSDDTNFVMTSAFMLECLTATHNRKSTTPEQTHTLQVAEQTVAELCSLLHWIPDSVTSVQKGKSNHKEEISALINQTQRERKTQNLWRTLPVNRLISLICDNDGSSGGGDNDIQSELLRSVLCISSSSSAEKGQLSAGKLHKTYSDNVVLSNNNNSKRDNNNTEKLRSNYISRSQIEAFILWWKTQAKHETLKERPQHDEEEETHKNIDNIINVDEDDEIAANNKANSQEIENQELFAPISSPQKEDHCVKRRQMLIEFMNAHGLLPESTLYSKALHGALLSNDNTSPQGESYHFHDDNNFTCQSIASLLLSRTTIEHIRQCIRKLQTSVSERESKEESQEESRVGHLSTEANSKCTIHDFVMIWKLYNAMELMDGPLLHSTFCTKHQSESGNMSSDTDSDEEQETTQEAEWMHRVNRGAAHEIKQNTLQTYSSYAIAGLHILSFFTHEVRNRSLQMECTHGVYCLVRSALYNLTQVKKHITREHIVHILQSKYPNVREIIEFDAKCDELIDAVKLTSSPVSRYCYVNLILPVVEGLCLFYKQPMSLYGSEHDNIHSVNLDDWFAHCRHRCLYWLQAGRVIYESIIKLYTLTQHCETYVPLIYCGTVNTIDDASKNTLAVKNKKRNRSSSVTEEHNTTNALLLLQSKQHCCNTNKDNVNEYNTSNWLNYIVFERSVANDLQKSQSVIERARREVLDPQLFITKLNVM